MTQSLLVGSLGLNTNADPAALPAQEDGKHFLISCNNVFIGDTGRINRCVGTEKIWTGSVHTIIKQQNDLYFASGTTLYRLSSDTAAEVIGTLPTVTALAHTTIHNGLHPVTFLSDGNNTRLLSQGILREWSRGEYYGPDTTVDGSITGPPPGNLLAYGLGRLFVASGNHVFMSVPNNPYLFNLATGRLSFEAEVTMIAPVKHGIWFGTTESIYYVSTDGIKFDRKLAASYGAFAGIPPRCDAASLPLQGIYGAGYIAPTAQGFAFLGQDSIFINLTEKTFELRRSDLTDISMTPYAAEIVRNRLYFSGAGYSLIMNLFNLGITEAAQYSMTACALHKSVLYFGNSVGLHKTSQSSALSAEFTFQSNLPFLCRLRSIEVTGEFSGTMLLDLTADETTTKTYTFTPVTGNKQTAIHFVGRRDNGKAKHWKFRFYNSAGSDFSVDQVRAEVINVPTKAGGYAL